MEEVLHGIHGRTEKLAKPYAEENDDFDGYDDGPEATAPQTPAASRTAPAYQFEEATRSESSKVVNIHATTQLQVIVVKPDRFELVTEIADHMRNKRAIVLNLESTEKDVARRLVDFLSGCTYALDGNIRKVAQSTYLATPYNVNIMDDLIDELESKGYTL